MQPLKEKKVVELGQNIAGPYAGSILAMLGADVLKIERPDGGDDARTWGPPFVGGSSPTYHALNINKRSVTLDMKDPVHLAWLKDTIAGADVLVHNLRSGVTDELGVGAEAMRALNPRLVYCSLRAFGAKGPKRLDPGYEPMVQAFAGLFSVNGEADRPGVRVGMQALDMGTGIWAALGIIAGLLERERTGQGCIVDTSLFETALAWLSMHYAVYSMGGGLPVRHPTGSNKVVVFQAFDTADGRVVIAAANDRLFAKLARACGHPEWPADPRYKTNADRVANKAGLVAAVAEVVRGKPSEHWIEHLTEVGVPCAPIQDIAQVEAHPQTKAVGMILPVPDLGHSIMGIPVSLDGVRPQIRTRAPDLGQHNAEAGVPKAKG
jgi:crotonobetainyl-CoA:carnitine CoA-transferase CaiB-like acyl-CoA transferase